MLNSILASCSLPSLPTRGAWIEIFYTEGGENGGRVAPHAGSVD